MLFISLQRPGEISLAVRGHSRVLCPKATSLYETKGIHDPSRGCHSLIRPMITKVSYSHFLSTTGRHGPINFYKLLCDIQFFMCFFHSAHRYNNPEGCIMYISSQWQLKLFFSWGQKNCVICELWRRVLYRTIRKLNIKD